ncbi:hypothetical protein [Tumebacillus permanentifrigoris]|uniref:Uncharacterized protein n=1 Tax=Tumebacillus permanentifrigoris TaxID=378543 RepID=A0A316D425_9BACL|nr:hypothetical protein [Tumebacillus permanentifrigoris]PWK03946.1 hypothetical protein C7459_1382 [Tumebacillus permanentifrigoris]
MTIKPQGRVVGGTCQNSKLTNKLDESVYAYAKGVYWLELLKIKMVPKKWNKPTRNGTKVKFIYPQSQEEFDKSYEDLKKYAAEIDEQYGLGIVLVDGPAQKDGEPTC